MTESRSDGWALLGLGTSIAGCLVIPTILGYLLDRGVGTTPLFTLVALVLGMATAGMYAYKEIRKIFGSGHD